MGSKGSRGGRGSRGDRGSKEIFDSISLFLITSHLTATHYRSKNDISRLFFCFGLNLEKYIVRAIALIFKSDRQRALSRI